jgi:hypothetical protein
MAFTIKMPACFINGAQHVSFESYFFGSLVFLQVLSTHLAVSIDFISLNFMLLNFQSCCIILWNLSIATSWQLVKGVIARDFRTLSFSLIYPLQTQGLHPNSYLIRFRSRIRGVVRKRIYISSVSDIFFRIFLRKILKIIEITLASKLGSQVMLILKKNSVFLLPCAN